jgi:hypothetical protein
MRERGFSFGKVRPDALPLIAGRVLVLDFEGSWPGPPQDDVVVWGPKQFDGNAEVEAIREEFGPYEGFKRLMDMHGKFALVVLYRTPPWFSVRDAFELSANARVICELALDGDVS